MKKLDAQRVAVGCSALLDALGLSMLGNVANISMVTPPNRKTAYDKSEANDQKKTHNNPADGRRITLEIGSKRKGQLY